MRIRQVRPEFFTDSVVGQLTPAVRLTYIGLWCVADDAGWLRWDTASIGALLYPFNTPTKRERHLAEAFDALMGVGRIKSYDCGCVFIPTLSVHQKIGGTKATTVKDAHDKGHKRKAPRPDVRTLVMQRDGYRCRYCGRSAREGAFIVLEHVINRGPTTLENCVTACQSCNRRKGTKTIEEAGMTLLPEPDGEVPDEYEISQTYPPVRVGNGSNGTLDARESATGEDPALIAAYRRQGLPVDVR